MEPSKHQYDFDSATVLGFLREFDLLDDFKKVVLFGTEEKIKFKYEDGLRTFETVKSFEGVIPNLERRWRETDSSWVRDDLARFQSSQPCETCGGGRSH